MMLLKLKTNRRWATKATRFNSKYKLINNRKTNPGKQELNILDLREWE
jgi:hypothetical protein